MIHVLGLGRPMNGIVSLYSYKEVSLFLQDHLVSIISIILYSWIRLSISFNCVGRKC